MRRAHSYWVLVVFLSVSLCRSALANAIISNFSFGQATWYDSLGVPQVSNSLWGRMDADFTGDATSTYYLNVAGSTGTSSPAWLVQNMPVFPTTIEPGTVRVATDFDISELGLTEGTALTSMNVSFSLTSVVQAAIPTGSAVAYAVDSLFYRIQSIDGTSGGAMTTAGTPAGHKATAEATNVTEHKNVPRVKEDDSECMPGAFARSLAWLGVKNKTAQQIYDDLRALMGIGKKLNETQRIKAKADYATGVTTKVRDIIGIVDPITGVSEDSTTDLLEWLRKEMKTEDVELRYTHPKGAHIVTLTGIYQQGDKWFVKYRDDESQVGSGAGAGDTAEKRAELGKTGTTYWFRNDKRPVSYAVSESVPEPSSLLGGLAGLALLALGRLRMVVCRRGH